MIYRVFDTTKPLLSDERKIKEWGDKRKHWFVGFREQ